MKPVNDYLVVEDIKEEVKVGGLVMTDDLKKNERYSKAKVLSVSDLCSQSVKDGDVIYYEKGGGFKLPINGSPKTIIKLRQVVIIE